MPAPCLGWGQDYALIQPLNMRSHEMLNTRINHAHRVVAAAYGVPQVTSLSKRKGLLAKLDFAMMLGRRSVGFGSSRANDLVFPKGHGVEQRHCFMHFDLQDGRLLLTDNSKTGTWIHLPESRPQLLHRATLAVSQGLRLSLGADRRFEFEVRITMPEQRPAVFQAVFAAYLKTLVSGAAGHRPGAETKTTSPAVTLGAQCAVDLVNRYIPREGILSADILTNNAITGMNSHIDSSSLTDKTVRLRSIISNHAATRCLRGKPCQSLDQSGVRERSTVEQNKTTEDPKILDDLEGNKENHHPQNKNPA